MYRVGALDDRQPQRMILRDILCVNEQDEVFSQLARRYLWASYDCMDYNGGVMLIHPALADPQSVIRGKRNLGGILMMPTAQCVIRIFCPKRFRFKRNWSARLAGCASRRSQGGGMLRQRCVCCASRGAPLSALEEVLQASLIVYVSDSMRAALSDLYIQAPKWVAPARSVMLQ